MSAREITQKYLERIGSIDKKINSIIEINPDALKIAEELDRERKAGKIRGALHGIPVVIKDNIDTADKMKTTAGSLALLEAPTPKQDASVADQLRKAGAIILAKTNLSEWANFRSNNSSSGWSGRGGQTRNPYILRPESVRFVIGNRRGNRGKSGGGRHRNGNRRFGRLPVVGLRNRRAETDTRFDLAFGNYSDCSFAGHSRTDDANCNGRGNFIERFNRR